MKKLIVYELTSNQCHLILATKMVSWDLVYSLLFTTLCIPLPTTTTTTTAATPTTRELAQLEVQCPSPPLDHGKYKEVPPYKYNSTLTAVCNKGYVYNGTDVRRCQQDNQWSGQEGTCIRIHCTKPQISIQNGWIEGCDKCEYGSRVKVICDKGYQNNGSALVCNEDENWDGIIGHCQEIHCTASVEIPNGRINISGLSYKSAGIISCKPDYRLSGNHIVYCQSDGTWSQPGTCLKNPLVALIYATSIGVVFGFLILTLLLAVYFQRRRKRNYKSGASQLPRPQPQIDQWNEVKRSHIPADIQSASVREPSAIRSLLSNTE